MERYRQAVALQERLREDRARVAAAGGERSDASDWKARAERLDGLGIEVRQVLAGDPGPGRGDQGSRDRAGRLPGPGTGRAPRARRQPVLAPRRGRGASSGTGWTRASPSGSRSREATARCSSTSSTRWCSSTASGCPRSRSTARRSAAPPDTSTRSSGDSLRTWSWRAFVAALFWSWQEAERIRAEDHREVGGAGAVRHALRPARARPGSDARRGARHPARHPHAGAVARWWSARRITSRC